MSKLPERWRSQPAARPAEAEDAHEAGARHTRSFARTGTLGILAFWLVVMGLLYLAMQQYQRPGAAQVQADGSLVIPRHSDGHFRVAGTVNGQPVMFMVDTGASLVSVTDALARKAGLTGGEPITFRTANGTREGRVAQAESVTVRSLAVSGLRVGTGYTGDDDEDALLGQNFLRHFDVEMRGDRMVLRPRGR